MNLTNTILKTVNVNRIYTIGNVSIEVLKNIEFELSATEIVAIIGPSGAGKTTLLHILGLIDKPTSGDVFIDSKNISNFSEPEKSVIRNQTIGFVFQYHHLLIEFTILENVMLPMLVNNKNFFVAKTRAIELLTELGLDKRLNHRPDEISFGEAQRVAIARALVNEPKIILADEPTGNLDKITGNTVQQILWEQVRKRNCSMVVVTHDMETAERADKILSLQNSCLV